MFLRELKRWKLTLVMPGPSIRLKNSHFFTKTERW